MDLKSLFYPESVAVIGASADTTKIGYQIVRNLKEGGYRGKVYPVNRKGGNILGYTVYPSIGDVPDKVDLAIISVPAEHTPEAAEECGKKGVFGIIVVASGFSEVGRKDLEDQLVSVCRKYNMRLLGPNVVGLMNNVVKLNASFAPYLPYPGTIGMVSQSGALIVGLDAMTWSNKTGTSFLISIGNMADLDFSDLVSFLADDENVSCISLYTEGLKEGRKFIDTARAIKKPIVMLKSGISKHGSVAAASHTGSLAGSHRVYDGALKQAGVVRANSIEELFDLSLTLSLQPPMAGDNLMVVTNGGGIGVLATDQAELSGIPLQTPPDDLQAKIRQVIPSFGSTKNPIDMSAMATPEIYADTLKTVMEDERVDGLVVLYCEVANLDPSDAAKGIINGILSSKRKIPVVAGFVGGDHSKNAALYLIKNGIPTFDSPDKAVKAMAALRNHKRMNDLICLGPARPVDLKRDGVGEKLKKYATAGIKSLNELESKEIFASYGIKVNRTELAKSKDELKNIIKDFKYPVVLKIQSPDIVHKTDVGGVIVNVKSEDEALKAFDTIISNVKKNAPQAKIDGVVVEEMLKGDLETIIGTVNDPTFGPTVMFGLGGTAVEVLEDVSFRVAPVCSKEAYDMIHDTVAGKMMQRFRGRGPLDIDAVVDQIVRFSWLAYDHPEIEGIDANPMIVNEHGATVVDARIMLSTTHH
ncbi:acetate--CoA ligase alpha subunit [Thermoplasma sp.]|uniref:acetate--CoA ligase alpha subunit n=1 Tax=Thermoplasma sp. TaxID=1973142 RepID=UPI00262A2097|nr:acetate--CoA ligase family protein [Thermoplasma sp.]